MSTEEFQIKTEVKLDTEKAEKEYQNFIKDKKDKIEIPIDIDAKIDSLGKDINNSLKRLSKKLNDNLQINNNTIKDIEKLDTVLKSLKTSINAMESTNIKIFNIEGFDPKLLNDNINNIENYVKKVENGYKKINDAKQNFNNTSKNKNEPTIDMSKSIDELKKFENKLEGLKYRFNNFDINIVGVENIQKIENDIKDIFDRAKKRSNQGLKVESPEIQKEIQNLREQEKLIRKVQTLYSNFQVKKIELEDIVDKSSIEQIDNIFRDAFRSITNMKDLKLDFNADALTNAMKNMNREMSKTKTDFLGIKKIASDFKSELASYTLGDVLGDAVTDFARDIGHSYIELDRSMREIKKVAEPDDIDSMSELNNIRKEAIDIAKDVGMASSDVQNSVASALQAGIGGMKESIEVAKQSMILANVGDMTQDSASKAINTVVKSFQLSPLKEYQLEVGNTVKKTTELKNAMDMMNFAGNNYAIGTDGIAEAMKRGGAVLASYNVSLADSIGLITATNEALQNPERVGNGLKTIAINLAGMKTNAKDGTMSLNKTAMALKELAGVDVYANEEKGELKNMVEILDEVQGKWSSMSDAQQKALSESIAGKLIAN
ncbi:phage tail tape measure protein [Fusobacterium sp.]|uniref:phage tail tape measure protein n=1 Tax=Fusobacterium sp. TaxID=68766 RepID=UPI00260A715C|nr:phage tail tape measure protein [Fusobacterium sp.]